MVYYEYCYNEHVRSYNPYLFSNFLLIYTQKSYCWIIWSKYKLSIESESLGEIENILLCVLSLWYEYNETYLKKIIKDSDVKRILRTLRINRHLVRRETVKYIRNNVKKLGRKL